MNQLSKPRIVSMAGEVTGLDMLMPKTRDKNQRGEKEDTPDMLPEKISRLAKKHRQMLAQHQ